MESEGGGGGAGGDELDEFMIGEEEAIGESDRVDCVLEVVGLAGLHSVFEGCSTETGNECTKS